MLEAVDYSNRRGVIVPMLPTVHAIMVENAAKDELAGLTPPIHIILWKQEMHRQLTDITRRWLFVLDGKTVAGFLFYHINGKALYIDELQAAWPYRYNEALFTLMLDKFQSERVVADCATFYVSDRIKKEENAELLSSVGFKETYIDGYQLIGALTDVVSAIKLRYGRRG